jgi:hypothetical protein
MGQGDAVEVGADMMEDDANDADHGVARAAEDFRGGTEEATQSNVLGTVHCWEEEVNMRGPRVGGGWVDVGVATDGTILVELSVFV